MTAEVNLRRVEDGIYGYELGDFFLERGHPERSRKKPAEYLDWLMIELNAQLPVGDSAAAKSILSTRYSEGTISRILQAENQSAANAGIGASAIAQQIYDQPEKYSGLKTLSYVLILTDEDESLMRAEIQERVSRRIVTTLEQLGARNFEVIRPLLGNSPEDLDALRRDRGIDLSLLKDLQSARDELSKSGKDFSFENLVERSKSKKTNRQIPCRPSGAELDSHGC